MRERRWHVAVPCLIGAAGFVLTVLGPADAGVRLDDAVDRGIRHLGNARPVLDAADGVSCAARRPRAALRW